MKRRRIAVVTTSRADYGLLYWVLRELEADPRVTLQLIVAGMHFSRLHGYTAQRIRADGFRAAAEVRAVPRDDSDAAIASAIGRTTQLLGAELRRLRPDLLVVLGDRYELLGVVSAATVSRIPIAHLHGGESTTGAVDDAIRHAVSKLAHIHLVAAPEYARRLRALGEESRRIHVVGAPGLDHLRRTAIPDPDSVVRELSMPSDGRPLLVVAQHPATLERGATAREIRELVRAISRVDARIVVTAPNADQEHTEIFARIHRLLRRTSSVRFVADLGSARYLGLLRAADVLIGNSSSGLVEAPSLGIPVVNVGPRQGGRLRAANVIDVASEASAINRAIARALTPAFRSRARRARNPYFRAGASRRIARILASFPLDGILLKAIPR